MAAVAEAPIHKLRRAPPDYHARETINPRRCADDAVQPVARRKRQESQPCRDRDREPAHQGAELVPLEFVDEFDALGDFRQLAGFPPKLASRLFVLGAKSRVSSLRPDYKHVRDDADETPRRCRERSIEPYRKNAQGIDPV